MACAPIFLHCLRVVLYIRVKKKKKSSINIYAELYVCVYVSQLEQTFLKMDKSTRKTNNANAVVLRGERMVLRCVSHTL